MKQDRATYHFAQSHRASNRALLEALCEFHHLRPHLSVEEHDEIVHAIEAGNADRVEAGLRQNWLTGTGRLGHVNDVFAERGSW
jgi:DNA-binding GntR family transcriptional regulator